MNQPSRDASRQSFWRLMRIMMLLAAAGVGGTFLYLYLVGVPIRLHFGIAIALGVALSILLAGLLMGLVFLSNRSGHDERVRDDFMDRDDE